MDKVMRCKLQCWDKQPSVGAPGGQVKMGAVWHGSTEKQAQSENAVFGEATPMAGFTATIRNQAVFDKLHVGSQYYVDFTEAPIDPNTWGIPSS